LIWEDAAEEVCVAVADVWEAAALGVVARGVAYLAVALVVPGAPEEVALVAAD